MSEIFMKTCSRCGEEKPLSEFNRDKKSGDGFRQQCKECRRSYRLANIGRIRETNRKWRADNVEHLRERQRAWYAANPNKNGEYHRKQYAKNPELIRERARQWRAENLEHARAISRKANAKRREANRQNCRTWYLQNRDYVAQRKRIWRLTNPDALKAQAQRRRARLRALPDALTAGQWERCKAYFNGCCAACGRPAGLWHKIVPDHWIPLVSPDCIGTVATNIIPLCHSKKGDTGGCNNSKKDTPAGVWLERRFGAKQAQQIMAQVQAYFEWVKQQEERDNG